MISNTHCYTTKGKVFVQRSVTETSMETAIEEILSKIDCQRGGLLAGSYEYPGRYKRWAIGFVNPPLELVSCDRSFTLTAHNERGMVLLAYLAEHLRQHPQLTAVQWEKNHLTGFIQSTKTSFPEEERSKQPSVFSIIREILYIFNSSEDEHLGLYGTFGYDLVFQFEPMQKRLERCG